MNGASDSDNEIGGMEPMGREKEKKPDPGKKKSPACAELLKQIHKGGDYSALRRTVNSTSRDGLLRQGELQLLLTRIDRLSSKAARQAASARRQEQDELFVEGPAGSKGASKPKLFRKPVVPERKSIPPEPVGRDSRPPSPPAQGYSSSVIVSTCRGIHFFHRRG